MTNLSDEPRPYGPEPSLEQKQLLAELRAMVRFGRNKGIAGIAEALGALNDMPEWYEASPSGLRTAHEKVAALLRPATPCGIMYVQTRSAGCAAQVNDDDEQVINNRSRMQKVKSFIRLEFVGAVPVVRWLIVAALATLISAAVIFTIDPDVANGFGASDSSPSTESNDGGTTAANGLTNGGGDTRAALSVLFTIALAGLGASFYTLFTAFRYVTNRSYDPVFNSTYLARFVLGLVAGFILAIVLLETEVNIGVGTLVIPVIGGFAADIVYRILTRLAKTLEFAILGDEARSETNRPASGAR